MELDQPTQPPQTPSTVPRTLDIAHKPYPAPHNTTTFGHSPPPTLRRFVEHPPSSNSQKALRSSPHPSGLTHKRYSVAPKTPVSYPNSRRDHVPAPHKIPCQPS